MDRHPCLPIVSFDKLNATKSSCRQCCVQICSLLDAILHWRIEIVLLYITINQLGTVPQRWLGVPQVN